MSTCHLQHAGLVGPYLAGALSKNGTDYSTPLITLGAFVLVAAVMLFGEPQQCGLCSSDSRIYCGLTLLLFCACTGFVRCLRML